MVLKNTDALIQLGICAAREGDFEKSVHWLEKAIEAVPSQPDLHYYLGNSFAALGKQQQAIHHLKLALSLDDNHAEAHNNLGRIFHQKGDFESASLHYQSAIQNRKNYSDAELNLGLLWVKQGKYHLAKKQFESILQWNTELPILYEQLAQIALQENHITQAEYYYKERLRFPIDSSDTWNNIGALFSQIGDYNEAIHAFTKALTITPKHIYARNNRAAIYLKQYCLKEAIWEYTLYLRLTPSDATAHYNLGVALMLSGRLQEATTAFKKAIELYPDYLEAWCNLGAIYIQQANPQCAYDAYQQVLLRQPQHETAQFMRSALSQSETLKHTLPSEAIVVPAAAPVGYVKELFNNYADHFEKHLLKTLNYQVPQQLHNWMRLYLKNRRLKTLDLGCGTGLVGIAFQSNIKKLIGVDISSEMLKEAKKKCIYDELIEQDILQFLKQTQQHYELILCVDTLVYFGELIGIMEAIFCIADPGAYFGFSVEVISDHFEDTLTDASRYYHLQPTGRYQHSVTGIRKVAMRCGWLWVDSIFTKGRIQNTQPVTSCLCLIQKPMTKSANSG